MGNNYKSPDFYKNYASLFHSYFQNISAEIITKLDDAGISIYQSAVRLDKFVDEGDTSEIFAALSLNEKAIQILARIYDGENGFWDLWQSRKNEFREAISLEKKLWTNPVKENYEEVADMKSSFGKVAIDCLYYLGDEKDDNVYKLLLQSHKLFSTAFQLYDDIIDFTEDYNNKQFNWA